MPVRRKKPVRYDPTKTFTMQGRDRAHTYTAQGSLAAFWKMQTINTEFKPAVWPVPGYYVDSGTTPDYSGNSRPLFASGSGTGGLIPVIGDSPYDAFPGDNCLATDLSDDQNQPSQGPEGVIWNFPGELCAAISADTSSTPTAPGTGTDDFTIMGWVKAQFSKGGNSFHRLIAVDLSDDYQVELGFHSAGSKPPGAAYLTARQTNGSFAYINAQATAASPANANTWPAGAGFAPEDPITGDGPQPAFNNAWFHFAWMWDGSAGASVQPQLYINGRQVPFEWDSAPSGAFSSIKSWPGRIYIGAKYYNRPTADEGYFLGGPAQFRDWGVWTSILSADDVMAAYLISKQVQSGYLNVPPRTTLRRLDCVTGSYPTVARSGDFPRTGIYSSSFNDQETVKFTDVYAGIDLVFHKIPPANPQYQPYENLTLYDINGKSTVLQPSYSGMISNPSHKMVDLSDYSAAELRNSFFASTGATPTTGPIKTRDWNLWTATWLAGKVAETINTLEANGELYIRARQIGNKVRIKSTIPGGLDLGTNAGKISTTAGSDFLTLEYHFGETKETWTGTAYLGRMTGGSAERVIYPFMLPAKYFDFLSSSYGANSAMIATPNTTGSNNSGYRSNSYDNFYTPPTNPNLIYATASVRRSVADSLIEIPCPGQTYLPFNDSDYLTPSSSIFSSVGTPRTVMPGFSQPLRSKTQISLNITPTTGTMVYFSTGSNTGGPTQQGINIPYAGASASFKVTDGGTWNATPGAGTGFWANDSIHFRAQARLPVGGGVLIASATNFEFGGTTNYTAYGDISAKVSSLIGGLSTDNDPQTIAKTIVGIINNSRNNGSLYENSLGVGNSLSTVNDRGWGQNATGSGPTKQNENYNIFSASVDHSDPGRFFIHSWYATGSAGRGGSNYIFIGTGPNTPATTGLSQSYDFGHGTSGYSAQYLPSTHMAYFNFNRNVWEKLEIDGNVTGSKIDLWDANNGRAWAEEGQKGTLGFSDGVQSPVPLSRITAGQPVSNLGFPFHSRYHASASQYIDMSDYITAPFLVEKIVLQASMSFPPAVNLHNPLMCNFFLMNQYAPARFSGSYKAMQGATEVHSYRKTAGSVPAIGSATYPDRKDSYISGSGIPRDIIAHATIALVHPATSDNLWNQYSIDHKIRGVDNTTSGNSYETNALTSSVQVAFVPKNPARVEIAAALVPDGFEVDSRPTYGLGSGDYLTIGNNQGGRDGLGSFSGRSLPGNQVGQIPSRSYDASESSTFAEWKIQGSGFSASPSPTSPSVAFKQSPYLLLPSDKLIIGFQGAMGSRSHGYQTSRSESDVYDVGEAQIAATQFGLYPGGGRVVIYGSLIRDHKEFHHGLNQPLTSDAIHEDIRDDISPYGEASCLDQWDVNPSSMFSGSIADSTFSGSMYYSPGGNGRNLPNPKWPVGTLALDPDALGNFGLPRKRIGSVARGTQGSTGSLMRGIVCVDNMERLLDTMLPSAAKIWAVDERGFMGLESADFDNNITSICGGVGTGILVLGATPASPASPKIVNDVYHRAFPFEARYNGIPRRAGPSTIVEPAQLTNVQELASEVGSVFLFPNITKVPAGSSDDFYYWVGTDQVPGRGGTGDGPRRPMSDPMLNKMLFGFGDHPYITGLPNLFGTSSILQKGIPGVDQAIASVQYTPDLIRGWRYGIANANPSYTYAVFRRDAYGQFRDMLEQRQYARCGVEGFQASDIVEGWSFPEAPVFCQYFTRESMAQGMAGQGMGRAKGSDTACQNISPYMTSSLPFFDAFRVRTDGGTIIEGGKYPIGRNRSTDPDEKSTVIIGAPDFVNF